MILCAHQRSADHDHDGVLCVGEVLIPVVDMVLREPLPVVLLFGGCDISIHKEEQRTSTFSLIALAAT
ncbi:MAG: hypothetical protein ABSF28_10610 [Terracidiphilus sp.]|jgi:hypothetical protein